MHGRFYKTTKKKPDLKRCCAPTASPRPAVLLFVQIYLSYFTLASQTPPILIPTSPPFCKLLAVFNTHKEANVKAKLISLAIVMALLVIALMQISAVVFDRQSHRQTAIGGVANSLAGAQTLVGPLIHVACSEEWEVTLDKGQRTERREFHLTAAPTTLDIKGASQLAPRSRGLHATQVFNFKAAITAEWADLQTLKPVAQQVGSRMSCGQPILMLSVSDARGIRHASLKLGEQPVVLKPGTFFGAYARGVHALLPANSALSGGLKATLDLELLGTEKISVVPLGGDTQVRISSNWPHPSFGGRFLPMERKVSDSGFDAHWRVSSLASTAQQDVAKLLQICQSPACGAAQLATGLGNVETLNITFVDPSNTYALSDRATKYGLLFIGLTFLAVGMFELMKSLRVHPIQYLLVGAAVTIFFLLLVSLSEHMAFGTAYAAAAGACVLLLTIYSSFMLQGWLRGLPFGLGIGLLYGLLYVLLQIEQTALLIGAVALFAVLAAIMLATRRIDWYARLAQLETRKASKEESAKSTKAQAEPLRFKTEAPLAGPASRG